MEGKKDDFKNTIKDKFNLKDSVIDEVLAEIERVHDVEDISEEDLCQLFDLELKKRKHKSIKEAVLKARARLRDIKIAGFWTQKIVSHKNMSKIKNLIIDMKEDILGEEYSAGDEDNFISDVAKSIDPLLSTLNKIAPKQPPKNWWSMMFSKIMKDCPQYDNATIDKVVGDIWYNRMDSKKKKEVIEKFELKRSKLI